jgi:hypothetical protein
MRSDATGLTPHISPHQSHTTRNVERNFGAMSPVSHYLCTRQRESDTRASKLHDLKGWNRVAARRVPHLTIAARVKEKAIHACPNYTT